MGGAKMARQPKGDDVLKQAKFALATARTAQELRSAQALILPLEFGFSLEQTAQLIGVSKRWACTLRNRFARVARGEEAPKGKRGGRKRQNMTPEEEARFLLPFLDRAKEGGVLVVGSIHSELENRLGRKVALSSVYNLLHRHGWRKLAPDKSHTKSDAQTQEEWKKNSPESFPGKQRSSRGKGRSV
jgi:transposase